MKQSVLCLPSHLTYLYPINPPNREHGPELQISKECLTHKVEHQWFSIAFFALLCNGAKFNFLILFLWDHALRKWFSTRGNIVCQRTSGRVWRHTRGCPIGNQ